LNPDNLLNAILKKLGNEYEFVRPLGGGGFSNVYLLMNSNNKMEYALKIMDYDHLLKILKNKKPASINEKLDLIKKRFLKEAVFYKTIDHPNIVKIHIVDVIENVNGDSQIPYLITNFINGKNLKDLIKDSGPLNFNTALKISDNILSALHTIHKKEFIHRDIKPGNIMIDSKTGTAILIDFGLAKDKLSDTTLTVSSEVMGTPAYMSPEQSRGLKGLDYKTDIYSFGIVLYEMLTGERPSMENVELSSDLPHGIENVLGKAMATDPRDRYKSAEEFLISLKGLRYGFVKSSEKIKNKAMATDFRDTYRNGKEYLNSHKESGERFVKSGKEIIEKKKPDIKPIIDANAIIKRVIAIITKPTEEWEVIKNESMKVGDMFTRYAIFLAAIPAIAGFIGFVLIGVSVMGFTVRYPMANALIWAIVTYVMQLVGIFVIGFVIDALATTFGAQKDMVGSIKTAVFASTPGWIAGILYIIPALSILAIIGGLYGLNLLYLGLKIVKNPPQDKLVAYFTVSLIVAAVVMWLASFITRTVTFGRFAGPMM